MRKFDINLYAYVQSSVKDSVKLNISLASSRNPSSSEPQCSLNTMFNATPSLPPSYYQLKKSHSTIYVLRTFEGIQKCLDFARYKTEALRVLQNVNTAKTNKKESQDLCIIEAK